MPISTMRAKRSCVKDISAYIAEKAKVAAVAPVGSSWVTEDGTVYRVYGYSCDDDGNVLICCVNAYVDLSVEPSTEGFPASCIANGILRKLL